MVKIDDRGVSPVIGVILMVAITVILAAVIGAFVLDMGQSAGEKAPQAAFSFDVDGNNVTVTMTGGEKISEDNTASLDIVVNETVHAWDDLPVRAGDSISVPANSSATVRVIWESSEGTTQTLAKFKVP